MTPARFRWGIIFILLGLLLLLRNFNILNDDIWGMLLIWSPVVLILIGIEKIFTRSKLQFISYLTSLALFAGGFLVAVTGGLGNPQGGFFSEVVFRLEAQPEVKFIKSELHLDNTDLTIRDSGRDLVFGKFDKYTHKPEIDYEFKGDMALVTLISKEGKFFGGLLQIDFGEPQDWYMRFSRELPLDLECYGYQSDMRLNFSTTPLRKLKLIADDAKVYLRLGDLEPMLVVTVGGEKSKLKLRIPENSGLRVYGDEYETYLTRIGLIKKDGFFVNEGFDTLESKIDIHLGDDLKSLSIDFF